MPFILLKINNVQKAELEGHEDLIAEIAFPGNQCAQAKMLRGVTYQGLPVYRVKTNKKERIVYTYLEHQGEKVLLILAYMVDHKYDKLHRQLQGLDSYAKLYQAEDESESDKAVVVDNKDEKRAKVKLDWVPVTYYNKMHIAHDEQQSKALGVALPLLLSGPPGSGKTGVVYTLLLKTLNTAATAAPETAAAPRAKSKHPIYFVSASQQLITTLEKTHESLSSSAVNFTTWNTLLLKKYPGYKLVGEEVFAQWSTKLFPDESPQTVHYELSLYAALGAAEYLKLKPRQSHFSGKKEQQRLILALHTGWVKYLNDNKLLDPMISMLPKPRKKEQAIIYCDEAQNLPPTALRSLMEHTAGRNFVACLDSEQCLYASSFIANCLKELLHKHFDKYSEQSLERSWRCPPKVTIVTTHILNLKHKLDGFQDRRPYSFVESVQKEPGVASWIKVANYSKLQQYGALAGTVVIVTQKPDATERALINKELGSNNIITAEEAIGLDFSTVILWKPITTTLRDAITKKTMNEEQKRAFHALFVGCSRAQKALFVCDPRPEFIPQLFASALEDNIFDVVSNDQKETAEQQKQQWETQIQYYLGLGNYDQARQIMSFHLKLSEGVIEKRIAEAKLLTSKPTPQDHKNPIDLKSKETAKPSASKPQTAVPVLTAVAATKTPLTEEEIKKKRTNYINGLLINPNEQNIINLLKLDNQKLEKFLFEPIVKGGDNLFQNLIKIPAAKTVLRQYITEKVLIKTALESCDKRLIVGLSTFIGPGAELLCEYSDGSCLFQRIVQNAEARMILFTKIYEENVARTKMEVNERVLNLRISDQYIRRHITNEFLTYTNSKDVIRPVFYWLTFAAEGRGLLRYLLMMCPTILKLISAPMLYQRFPDNDTPFYWLLWDQSGIQVVTHLVHSNLILHEITTEVLCLPLNKSLGGNAFINSSILGRLTEPGYRHLLLTLLSTSDGFAGKITSSALHRQLPDGIGKYSKRSPFVNLTFEPDGHECLKVLLIKNPSLCMGVNGDILFFQLLPDDPRGNCFPLHGLCSTETGIVILQILFSTNPSLLKEINAYMLLMECYDSNFCLKSARDLLKATPEGEALLAKFPSSVVNLPNIPQTAARASALKPSVTAVGIFPQNTQSAAGILPPPTTASAAEDSDYKSQNANLSKK